jgi:OOP family OmpA-OmpF porin
MKTVFTRTALLVVLSGSITTSFAQTTMSDIAKRYDRKSFRTWSVGLHAGVLSPFTPFNSKNNGDFRTNRAEWGYGGYIKKQILPGFGIQADFLAGEVSGRRSNALPDNTVLQDASGFRSHIDWSGSVSANLTVANLGFNHERSFLTPYLTAGAGYMSSAAKVFNTSAGANTNFEENWFIPIGAGFKL